MRLNSTMIRYLSQNLANRMVKSKAVDTEDTEKVARIIERILTAQIELEKKIEEEAHKILRQHIREIEQQGVSYQKMFNIIKQKLAKERGLKL